MGFGVGLNVLIDPFFILGFQGNVLFAWLGLEGLEAILYAATGFAGFGVQGASDSDSSLAGHRCVYRYLAAPLRSRRYRALGSGLHPVLGDGQADLHYRRAREH